MRKLKEARHGQRAAHGRSSKRCILVLGQASFLLALPQVMASTECLVGCMLNGTSPFDDENVIAWDLRETCDSATLGCEVSAINYPPSSFSTYLGALWVSTSGTDGSTDCTCNICDPYDHSDDPPEYMEDEGSLWTRIQCYLAAAEASGWDVSPCVSAIIDGGTLPCVDVPYEAPTVGQFACEANGIGDLDTSSSYDACAWAGEAHDASEMFGAVSHSASSGSPTASETSPAPSYPNLSPSSGSTPPPSTAPGISTTPPSTVSDSTTAPADSEEYSELAPSNTEDDFVQSSAPGTGAPVASIPPAITVDITCDVGQTCTSNLCCHPDYKTCGRKYTFCQERDMFNGAQCCSGVDGDPSAENVCSEDYICDEPEGDDGLPIGEAVAMWTGIGASGLAIFVGVWQGYEWGKRRRGRRRANETSPPEQQQQ